MNKEELANFLNWVNNNWFIATSDGFWKQDTENDFYRPTIDLENIESFWTNEEIVEMYMEKKGEF